MKKMRWLMDDVWSWESAELAEKGGDNERKWKKIGEGTGDL